MWEAGKLFLKKQVKTLKLCLVLKYESLLTNALLKTKILNIGSFLTSRGINYNWLLQESTLIKKIEIKKCNNRLRENSKPTVTDRHDKVLNKTVIMYFNLNNNANNLIVM